MNCAGRSSGAIAGKCGPDHRSARTYSGQNLDAAELEQISEIWGMQFAEALIKNPRWSTCDQPEAIRAAGVIVKHAIREIVATLDRGDDFRPHTTMMAQTISGSFYGEFLRGPLKFAGTA
jgi:hypothetical protein